MKIEIMWKTALQRWVKTSEKIWRGWECKNNSFLNGYFRKLSRLYFETLSTKLNFQAMGEKDMSST